MTGHRPISELAKAFTPERRARVAAKAAELREEMTLEELRKARSHSQGEMAATLNVGQPAVAKLEKRADMHVSNLRRYVEALGGTLEITARFAEASVALCGLGTEMPAASQKVLSEPRMVSLKTALFSGVDPQVLARYRATGDGWRLRLNKILKAGLAGIKGASGAEKTPAAKRAKIRNAAGNKTSARKRA